MRTQPLAVAVHACQRSMDLGLSPVGLGRLLAIADAESDSPHPRGFSLFEWSSGFPLIAEVFLPARLLTRAGPVASFFLALLGMQEAFSPGRTLDALRMTARSPDDHATMR